MTALRLFPKWMACLQAPLVRAGALLSALTLGIAWLSWAASRVDAESHLHYLAGFRQFAEIEARIDGEILALHHGLSHNYDALNQFVVLQQSLLQAIFTPPVHLADDTGLRRTLAALNKDIEERNRHIEDFKRHHAALRQASQFFPAEIHDLLGTSEIAARPLLAAQLSRFALYALRFVAAFGEEERKEAQELLEALSTAKLSPAAQQRLAAALRHADLLMKHQPDLDRVTRAVLATRHHDLLAAIFDQLDAAWSNAEISAQRYRTLLAILALLTALLLGWMFLHLEQARRSLAKSQEELESRLAAQLAAEEKLRLHALVFNHAQEGIIITNDDRRILAVNPAFTRITGYAQEEVIGQNPRLLQSERHDAAFYETMWRSIEAEGRWQGEIWNRKKNGEVYPEMLSIVAVRETAKQPPSHYIGIFNDLSQLKAQQRMLQRLAFYDALTGLANRTLLADHLSQAIALCRRSGKIFALLMLDLDGFKVINTRFGKEAGNRSLEEIAERLAAALRAGDTAARLGGDEFALLLLDVKDANEAARAAQRFLALIDRPFAHLPADLRLSASIGITLFPEDDSDADTLLRHAEQAMIRSKQTGKNRWSFFDSREETQLLAQYARLERFRAGLARGEFILHFQPKVDLRSGRVLGAEALVRWQHPDEGLLGPLVFLPDIEHTEQIITLGNWVLAAALQQLAVWRNEGLAVDVAVNIAPRQLMCDDFPSQLEALKQRWPEVFDHLQIEVVESEALGDLASAARQLQRCRAVGVKIALDDFGAGYSSLTYLKGLPLDLVKIDQNFVRTMLTEPENLPIIEGVAALAHAFDLPILAEGVESVDHACMLMMLGCDWAQGYGIARPMPASEFSAWARAWQAPAACAPFRDLYWRHEHRTLLRLEVHLRNYAIRLLGACQEGRAVPEDFQDYASCLLTQWCQREGMKLYGTLPSFLALQAPHRELHALAESITAALRTGRTERLMELATEIEAARATALAHLRELYLALGEPRRQ